MLTLFSKNKTAKIGIEKNAPDAIRLAALDLQRNLRTLAARKDGFDMAENGDIRIATVGGEAESYKVTVTDGGVCIEGGDTLGTVFGIYAFATRVLGIDPMYRLNDVFPSPREEMTAEDTAFCSLPRVIRFRGWFLNDEDLLTEFKSGGGVRHFDYKFYQTVMHPDVLEMILETALRHEINLMIPSSFVDVDNPDEEKLAAAVVRRGMYVTQHHVEPLGVSYFGAQNYFKKYNCEGEISFISNRAVMEEIWEYYVRKWAKYGDRVIWQFGLRGRGDEAMWKRDKNAPVSAEGRGAIITDAIQTQYETVKRVLGHENFHSTATLWLEGAELYGRGFLKLPLSTMPIFSDVGLDQMWGEDFFSTPRLDGVSYGVYYHIGFWGRGPHLAEGCDPRKMTYCYRLAHKMNSLTYSIVNVSNVRPLQYGVSYNAYLMANPVGADYETYANEFHRRHFGDTANAVLALRNRYFLSKAEIGEDNLREKCEKSNFYYHRYDGLPFIRYTADDGELHSYSSGLLENNYRKSYRDSLVRSEKAFATLYEDALVVEKSVPEESLDYFRTFLLFQIEYMLCMTRWALAVHEIVESDGEKRQTLAEQAVKPLLRILEARKIEAQGGWASWHMGDKKLNVLQCIERTRAAAQK